VAVEGYQDVDRGDEGHLHGQGMGLGEESVGRGGYQDETKLDGKLTNLKYLYLEEHLERREPRRVGARETAW